MKEAGELSPGPLKSLMPMCFELSKQELIKDHYWYLSSFFTPRPGISTK